MQDFNSWGFQNKTPIEGIMLVDVQTVPNTYLEYLMIDTVARVIRLYQISADTFLSFLHQDV